MAWYFNCFAGFVLTIKETLHTIDLAKIALVELIDLKEELAEPDL